MACGVTFTDPVHGALTCNNAGTSAHAGQHTATVAAFTFRGVSVGSKTVRWITGNTSAAVQGTHTVGQAYP